MASMAGGGEMHALLASTVKELIWYDSGRLLPVAYVPDARAWFVEHL